MNNNVQVKSNPIAWLAFWLAIGSLAAFGLSVPLAFIVATFGLASALGPIALLAIVALILGVIGLSRTPADPTLPAPGRKTSIAAIAISATVLFLTIAIRVVVFLIFIPGLGA